MARIPKSYQLSHDIDWFFRTDNRLCHCASNSSIIPDRLDDRTNLRIAQEIIASMPIIFSPEQITVNEEYEELYVSADFRQMQELFNNEFPLSREDYRAQYLDSFIRMAQRGLWSFDHAADMAENEYLLVAHPAEEPQMDNLLDTPHPLQGETRLESIIPAAKHFKWDMNRLYV